MKSCVLFDIDGTLADGSHRQHLIRGPGKKNWPAYQKLAYDDAPHWPVIGALRAYGEVNNMTTFIVSGRGEQEREVTEKWLNDKAHIGRSYYHSLFMRPARDSRPDTEIKEEILRQKIMPLGYWPQAVFDDRPRVVAMWRSLGIFVFDCQQIHDDF
jgi:hypothetical protein